MADDDVSGHLNARGSTRGVSAKLVQAQGEATVALWRTIFAGVTLVLLAGGAVYCLINRIEGVSALFALLGTYAGYYVGREK